MAYNNISKLQRTFVPGQILYAREVTESDSKTNEIIDALNGIGPTVDGIDSAVDTLTETVGDVSTAVHNMDASVTNISNTVINMDSSVKQIAQDVSGKMNDDGSNYKGSKPLVTPTITSVWKIYDASSALKETKTANVITIESGATVTWDGTWKWEQRDGYKDPTSCSGLSANLPDPGNVVTIPTQTNIKTNTTFTETLSAPASGLVVRNNVVVKAEGNDTTSASASVTFKGRQYFGGYDTVISTDEQLATALSALVNTAGDGTTKLNTTWVNTGDGIKIKYEGLKYIYFIYPSAWGNIEKTTTDGANTYSDWDVKTLNITNTYGVSVPCYVYRTTGQKTTGSNGIVFRFYKVN